MTEHQNAHPEFHAQDGLRFQRLPCGGVRVRHTAHGGTWFETTLSKETWASVVASVSAGGEDDGRFYPALALHDSAGRVEVREVSEVAHADR